jgi:hypothetical protein
MGGTLKNVAIVAIAAWLYFTSPVSAEDAQPEVWVALTVTSGEPLKGASEYCGLVQRADYDALLSGTGKGFVSLQKAFFISKDKQIVRWQDMPYYGYSDQISFRAVTVIRARLLRKSYIESVAKILDAPNKTEAELSKEKAPPDDVKVKDKDF